MNDDKQPQQGNPWMKSLLIWVGILAALAVFVSIFDGRTQTAAASGIPYSEFVAKVDEGSVKSVVISNNEISGNLSNGEAFRTFPVPDPQLTARLTKANVDFRGKPEESASIWVLLLYQALPFVSDDRAGILCDAPDAEERRIGRNGL